MKIFQNSILLIIVIFFYSHNSFSEETLKFSTLEWPPYLGSNLPNQGLGIEILKEAFKAEGYNNIQVDFFPWSRTLAVVDKGENYIGCLLAYYSSERQEKFIFSDPVISSPVKFAIRTDNLIKWNKLEDLKDKKIGVVQDYINSPELDKLFAKKILRSDSSISDLNNLEKLAFKRTDMAIVDENVFYYLLKTHPRLQNFEDKLQLDPKLLDDKKLYVLFSKNQKGEKFAKIFNNGLKKINARKIALKYMEKI